MKETTQKRIKVLSILFLVFFSSFLAIILAYDQKKKALDDDYFISCRSLAHLGYSGNEAHVQISIKLNKKSSGEIAFAGEVTSSEGKNYRLSRVIDINFSHPTFGTLIFYYNKSLKSVVDNVNDELFDIMLYDTKKDMIKLFISRYQNGYIISNYFSPMIMCADESQPVL